MTVFLSSILLLCLIACDTSPSPETSDADTSSAISTDSDAGTEAPGTLTNVDKLPTADASEVGKKISVSLAPNGETNEIGFVFRRNAETGRERLVTIENTAGSQSVCCFPCTRLRSAASKRCAKRWRPASVTPCLPHGSISTGSRGSIQRTRFTAL